MLLIVYPLVLLLLLIAIIKDIRRGNHIKGSQFSLKQNIIIWILYRYL